MARLGPWDAARRVAVAVSGGADSLALALLTSQWGDPCAFVVDHGLRPSSAQEAERTRAVLVAMAIPAKVLTLRGLQPGSGMPARARAARYQALEAAVAEAGLVDLLLGHHAGDQAETILMRSQSGSGARGLAGMAAVAEGRLVRRVRPLLHVRPERLRACLEAAGLDWVEDPTNHDNAYTRARMRAEMDGAIDALLVKAEAAAGARRVQDMTIAAVLAERASIFPEGYALLSPGPIDPLALGQLLQAISGRPYAPSMRALAALALTLRPATLGGVRVMDAGRLGPGWLLVREASSMQAEIPVRAGAVWDRRYRVATGTMPDATIGALGAASAGSGRYPLPLAVLQTLPAVRVGGVLCATALPAYIINNGFSPEITLRHDRSPACGAPFLA